MKEQYARDRIQNLGLLLVFAILIHIAAGRSTCHRRPAGRRGSGALQAADAEYQPQRSFMAILLGAGSGHHLALWALALAALKARALSAHRRQLDKGLLSVPAGYRILPGDVREYSHKLEDLPGKQRELIPVRTLRRACEALRRNRQCAGCRRQRARDYCESESARLDAELAVIRFCVLAIPAVGFVGTVRGPSALAVSRLALRGECARELLDAQHADTTGPSGVSSRVIERLCRAVGYRFIVGDDAGPQPSRGFAAVPGHPAGAGAVPRGGVDPAGAGGAGRRMPQGVARFSPDKR